MQYASIYIIIIIMMTTCMKIYFCQHIVILHSPCFNYTSKEKHSLTRKVVGYRNWNHKWCRNKVFGKEKWDKNPIFSTSFGSVGFLSHFSFPKTLFPPFLHHLYLQFLYSTNFLVRECFSLLVSSIFLIHIITNML